MLLGVESGHADRLQTQRNDRRKPKMCNSNRENLGLKIRMQA